MKLIPILFALAPLCAVEVRQVRPGDDPQRIVDAAAPGDRIVFLPGVHVHPVRKHRSLLYVDKSLDIELQPGAVLKMADRQSVLEKTPEITTDHGAPKTIDDFQAGGDYDLGLGAVIYTIRIDSVGAGSAPDTFTWGSGGTFDFQHAKVPITGDWQELSHGVKIRFDNRTGHSMGSLWFISYDGPETYGIRIGHGTQPNYIENVRIFGKGTIDLNSGNNAEPSGLVRNINACVLVHGRVRNVSIEDITMANTMRSVMLYGEHTGKFLQGGGVGPGESFDAENLTILHTRTINPKGSGYLLGHPSHRGRLHKVRCNFNYMETATTSIEPNFQLDQYEVIGNVIKSAGRAIHCWRRSTNGLIVDNVRIDDTTGKEVVMVNAPGAWQNPENIIIRDNRNHQSEPLGYWATVAGGLNNSAKGAYASATGGRENLADAPYSRAQGWQARAKRPAEDVLAGGAFQAAGDAQTSVLIARGVTNSANPVALTLAGNSPIAIPRNATVAFRMLIAARSASASAEASFEASGSASVHSSGKLEISGLRITPVHRTSESLNIALTGGPTGNLELNAKGQSGTQMRWVARIEFAEVEF